MGTLVGIAPAEVVAHAGGWDEILFVLAPLVLVAGLLVAANRRAKRLLASQTAALTAMAPPAGAQPEATGPPEGAPPEPDSAAEPVPTPGTFPADRTPPTDER